MMKHIDTVKYQSMNCLSRKPKFDPSRNLLDLTGKVVLVTGGNTGIGYETVKHLARRGAKVYLGARNESKATGAIAKLEAEGLGSGKVLWLKVEYSDPRYAANAAQEFLRRETRLDVLVNNAGQLTGPYEKTSDGISKLMMVNHFSPTVFTKALLPLMIETSKESNSDVRIVTLSSRAHDRLRGATPNIRFNTVDDFNGEFAKDFYPEFSRYTVTKLVNILWTRALQKRLDAANISITCIPINPGDVNTFASRTIFPTFAKIYMGIFYDTPDVGSYNSCFAAASPLVRKNPEKYKGVYLTPVGKITEPGKNARNEQLADELWDTTERILKELGVSESLEY